MMEPATAASVVVMYDRTEGRIESVHGPFDDEAVAETWAWPNGHRWSWAVLPLEAVDA